ncbi:hypothetical protein MMC17_009109 [Xylographa soralifera]|nr:hypothetical protein [Xylographa soralifera]
MSAPPPLPPRHPAPPVPSAIGNAARAAPPLPPRRTAPSVSSASGVTSLASSSMPSMPTIAEDTRPQTFPPPPTRARPIATPAATTTMSETNAFSPTAPCGPPYLVQPLFVSKGKNRKVTILAQAGKKRRVSVEEFNRLNGHHGAADNVVSSSIEADEDLMVGSSTVASQAPPPPAPAPSEAWRPSTPPADMWKIPLVLGTAKKESWWLQEASTYRQRLEDGDLRRETKSLVKSASMDDLLAEQEGPHRTEPLGFIDGKDRLMELSFDYLEAQTFEEARPGLRAARVTWEGQEAERRANDKGKQVAGQEDMSKLASLGRRLLKKPSAYFRKQSEE